MESCDNNNIRAVFLSFFKGHEEAWEGLHYGPYDPQSSIACCYMKCLVALSCWHEEDIKEVYCFTKNYYKTLLKLQLEHQTFGTPVEKILLKVVTGEALMLVALMKLAVKRCMKNYIKAGFHLRTSWIIYSTVQSEIQELCAQTGVPSSEPGSCVIDAQTDTPTDTSEDAFLSQFDLVDMSSYLKGPTMSDIRMLKTISQFGFGLFHMVLSLVPPRVLKIVNLLGFEGSRHVGISTLWSVAQDTANFRGLFASIVLLWYNLLLRPTLFKDEQSIKSGIAQGEMVLAKLKPDLEDSWTYLFFVGRIAKLRKEYQTALETFQLAAVNGAHLTEIKLLVYYEIGWCHMITFQWQKASDIFIDLLTEARWYKGFYSYLAGVTAGAAGHVTLSKGILHDVPSVIKRTVNMELDHYCSRRSQYLFASEHPQYDSKLAALELLYLWRTLHFTDVLAQDILDTVQGRPPDLPPSSLAASFLLTGLAWLHFRNHERAEQALKVVQTIKYQSNKECYYTVCALCELSAIYHAQQQHDLAHQTATMAREGFRGYDLENILYLWVKSRQY